MRLISGLALFALGMMATAEEPPKTPLDKLNPKTVATNLKFKGMPKDVIAVLGERDGRYDSVAFSADGKLMAIGGTDSQIRLWDLTTLRLNSTVSHKEPVSLAFSPTGKTLAASDSQGNIRLWTINFGKLALGAQVAAHKGGPIWGIAYAADGKSLYSTGTDRTVKIWDMTKSPPSLKHTLSGHADRVRGIATSRDGKWLASTSDRDKTIHLWDISGEPKEHATFKLKGGALCVAFSPDGKTLAAGCNDGNVLTWKLGDKVDLDPDQLRYGQGIVYSLSFAPDGESLLGLVKWDNLEDRVFVWKLDGKERYVSKYGMKVEAASFDPGGRHLILVNEASAFVVRLKD